MGYYDTRGLFGPAGMSYFDGRYNDQNDYNTWTDPAVSGLSNGINPRTGQPWHRGDAEFGNYTAMAQAKGQAEADRQAAEDDDGFGGLMQLALLAAAIYSGGAALGAWGGAGAASGAGLAGAAEGALGGALGSGMTAGGGLGLTTGGGLGLTGTATGLGTVGAGGALTSAGLAGTGLGAGWAGLEAALGSGLSAGAGAAETLGSGISATGGSTGLTGTITGDLAGNLGALGSTTGGAGLTGTIPGLGTLTAEGVLLPAAGGAAGALGAAEGVATATGLEAGANAGSELYGLEVGGEGVGSGLETLADSGYIDTLGGAGEVVDSNFYFDDWGVGSNAAGDMTNAAGNRAWQDVAAETLRDLGIPRETAAKMVTGLSSSITSILDPKNAKQLISNVLGGGSTPTKTGTAKAAAGAGGAGGINIFNTGGDDSGLADAMKIFSGGRSGMDSVVQAMSQSGKGN